MPNQYLVDIGIGKHFNLGKGTDLSIDLQILNLQRRCRRMVEKSDYPVGEEPLPGGWVLPRRAQLRARISF